MEAPRIREKNRNTRIIINTSSNRRKDTTALIRERERNEYQNNNKCIFKQKNRYHCFDEEREREREKREREREKH